MSGRLVLDQLRHSVGPVKVLLCLLIVAVPVVLGSSGIGGVVLRDNLDVYSRMMGSPLELILPLIAVLAGCLGFYQEIGNRFASNTRVRVDVKTYVGIRYLVAGVWGFAVFFLLAFVAFVVAFYIWPTLGNPSINPGSYHLTPEQAVQDSYGRANYTSLLQFGPLVFGLIYSVWVGLSGAIYAMLGIASLLLLRNRVLALALPFLLYFVETILAAILGSPNSGLVYSLFPFGLSPVPLLVAVLPTFVIGLATALTVWKTIRRAPLLEKLA